MAVVIAPTIAAARLWVADHRRALAGFLVVDVASPGASSRLRGRNYDAAYMVASHEWPRGSQRRVLEDVVPSLVVRDGLLAEVVR